MNTPPTLRLEQTVFNIRESIRSLLGFNREVEGLSGVEPHPIASFARQQNDESDTVVRIDLEAEDAEGNDLIFEVVGAPPTSEFDSLTGAFRWEPGLEDGDGPKGFRIWSVLFRVKEVGPDDLESLSDEKTVRIRVEDRNLIPKLDSIPDQEVVEGELLSVAFQAADFDGDPITFVGDNLPTGARLITVSPGRAKLEWQPPFDAALPPGVVAQRGGFEVTVKALDPKQSVIDGQNSQRFTINVLNTNQPPVLVSALSNQRVIEGDLLRFSVVFTDPDFADNPNEVITLTVEGIPPGAEFTDNGDGTGVFRWQTDFNSFVPEGNETTFVAADGAGDRIRKSVLILVQNVNQAPAFDELDLPSLVELDGVTFQLIAEDPDNPDEPLRFEVEGNLPSGGIQVAGDILLIQTDLDDAGEYPLIFRVFDTEGGVGETSGMLRIAALNLPPEIVPIPSIHNGVEGEEVQIAINATDPNGDFLSLSLEGAPAASAFNLNSGVFLWTPGVGEAGEYDLTFIAAETATTDGFTTSVSTRLVIISRVSPIIRGLNVDGQRGTVEITFNLEITGDNRVDATITVGSNGESFSELTTFTQLVSGPVSFDWDTFSVGFGLADVTRYFVRVTATDGIISNSVTVGPLLIDNAPPFIDGSSLRNSETRIIVEFAKNVESLHPPRLCFLKPNLSTRRMQDVTDSAQSQPISSVCLRTTEDQSRA